MKISLIIISTILVLSVFLPFLLFVYNGTKNTSNIKKRTNKLIKDNGIDYSYKEIWRKNFIGISNDYKILTNLFLENENPIITNIILTEIKQCNIIKTHYNNSTKTPILKSLALEFVYKSTSKQNISITFFNIDVDLSEDFELQRIEKWHALIKNAITESNLVKMAS